MDRKIETNLAGRKILFVDDHEVLRQGLRRLVENEGYAVCGEAEDGHQGLQLLQDTKPDLVIVDLSLPEMSGLELIKNIHKRNPKIAILVVSMHDEAIFAERALRAGARGYVMKNVPAKDLLEAVRRVISGGLYLSSPLADRLLVRRFGSNEPNGTPTIDSLSDRELEVVQFIGQGLKTSEIATRMCLSKKTIETYREKIKDKMNLANASELNRFAINWVHSNRLN